MDGNDRIVRSLLDGNGNVISVATADQLLGNVKRLEKFNILRIDDRSVSFSRDMPDPRNYTLKPPFYFYVPIECNAPTDGVFDLICIPVEHEVVFRNVPVKGEFDKTPNLPNDYRFSILRGALRYESNTAVVNYYRYAAAAFAAQRFEKTKKLGVGYPDTGILDVVADRQEDEVSGILGRLFGF